MDDLISRQAAQEEIARRDTTDGTIKVFSGREVNEMLSSIPSAQPTQNNYSNALDALDCVSRQAAIDAVKAYLTGCQVEDADWHGNGIEDELNNLPTAQPERDTPKRGRWVQEMYYEPATCSECGGNALALSLIDEFGDEVLSRYCPHCGAKMENAEVRE